MGEWAVNNKTVAVRVMVMSLPFRSRHEYRLSVTTALLGVSLRVHRVKAIYISRSFVTPSLLSSTGGFERPFFFSPHYVPNASGIADFRQKKEKRKLRSLAFSVWAQLHKVLTNLITCASTSLPCFRCIHAYCEDDCQNCCSRILSALHVTVSTYFRFNVMRSERRTYPTKAFVLPSCRVSQQRT